MNYKFLTLVVLIILNIQYINTQQQFAVLVAGSNTYSNYRHQSDICHSYHVLVNNGIPAENIIVMSYDDVAYDSENPFPGTLYNQYTGKNAGINYNQGCIIDYKGKDVTVENYLNILQGNSDSVEGGNGRVLESTEKDTVFLFYSDHGSPGLVAFPNGQHLYADQLNYTFEQMFGKKMYNKMVFYLEACESGSMFVDLNEALGIYALSAANPVQSSWERYCPPLFDEVYGIHINSCLGDEFSVSWMENSQFYSTKSITLQQQFEIVKKNVLKSEVMQWGDLSYVDSLIGEFQGQKNQDDKPQYVPNSFVDKYTEQLYKYEMMNIQKDSRHAELNYLERKYQKVQTQENFQKLQQEKDKNQLFDKVFDQFTQKYQISGVYDQYESTNFDCYRHLINTVQQQCGRLNYYSYKNFKYFYQFCQSESNISLLEQQQFEFC